MEVASSNAERLKGLSGRDSLPDNKGMLFVFEKPAEQCIWMKDMLFNIDIIWLNESKEAIRLERNVAPETYPDSFCADDTKYVIELNSGQSDVLGFMAGKRVDLPVDY